MDVFSADWLGICRRAVAAQRQVFDEVRGIEARTVYEGVGEGGDHTLVIDRRCEDAVFAELEALAEQGASFVAVSEERGEVGFGSGGEARVVIDPIDGSLNARRTLPSHSLSIAVASGPSMADVEFGYVYDFGAGEEFVAAPRRAARRSTASRSRSARTARSWSCSGSSRPSPSGRCRRSRRWRARSTACGSSARSRSPPAYVAAGRFDAMISLRPCRSVDAAAAQLIVREAGGLFAFGDSGPRGRRPRPRRALPGRRRGGRARHGDPAGRPVNRPGLRVTNRG